ncbi:hypothetical protein [Moraxella lacunata]
MMTANNHQTQTLLLSTYYLPIQSNLTHQHHRKLSWHGNKFTYN